MRGACEGVCGELYIHRAGWPGVSVTCGLTHPGPGSISRWHFKMHFLERKLVHFILVTLNFGLQCPVKDWHWTDAKPQHGPMMKQFIDTYIHHSVSWLPYEFNKMFRLAIFKITKQATGLDAWASRVKCPARFVSHLHDICIYMSCL